MIRISAVRGQKLKDFGLNDLKKKDIAVIDCVNPTKKELNDIKTKFSIRSSDITLALDNESRPRLMDSDEYSMIIFTSATKDKTRILTMSFGMFILDEKLIIIRKNKLDSFDKLHKLKDDIKLMEMKKGVGYMAYLLIEYTFDNYMRLMDELEDDVNKLEKQVFKKPDESIIKKIFRIKKDLIYVHKALVADREVISGIEKEYLTHLNKKDIKKFRYVYHDATELIEMGSTYKDILTGTLEIYMSSVSNKMNEIMKKLTAWASFILIPTLISGIYGMNFESIKEFRWAHGYYFALGIMVISVVIMYVYFKEKDYL